MTITEFQVLLDIKKLLEEIRNELKFGKVATK